MLTNTGNHPQYCKKDKGRVLTFSVTSPVNCNRIFKEEQEKQINLQGSEMEKKPN